MGLDSVWHSFRLLVSSLLVAWLVPSGRSMKLCNLKRSLKGCDLLEATFGVNLYRHLIQILIQMAHSTICSLFLSLPLSKVFFFSTFAFGNLITGCAFRQFYWYQIICIAIFST